MCELTEIKAAVKKAYSLLPANYKKVAAKNQKCSHNYFRSIVAGEPKDYKVYEKALKSILNASQKPIKDLNKRHQQITDIVNAQLATEKECV